MRRTMAIVIGVFALYALPAAAQQPPVIVVVGKGQVAMDQPATDLATAQSYTYRAYVGTQAAKVVTATCTGAASPFRCTFQLADLALTPAAQSLAVTAAVVAVDGELESEKGTAPFVLSLAAPPASPLPPSFSIRPGS